MSQGGSTDRTAYHLNHATSKDLYVWTRVATPMFTAGIDGRVIQCGPRIASATLLATLIGAISFSPLVLASATNARSLAPSQLPILIAGLLF